MLRIEVYHNSPDTPYDGMRALLNTAFKKRKEEGIDFVYASYTNEELKEHVGDGYCIVAFEDSLVVGMVALLQKKRFGIKYSTHECLAVLPTKSKKGIASLMFKRFLEVAVEINTGFVISTTAEKAYSSIRYHHKNGFKTFLFVSFPSTSYYSYCFIYPIKQFRLLKYDIFNKPLFWLSYLFTKLFFRESKRS